MPPRKSWASVPRCTAPRSACSSAASGCRASTPPCGSPAASAFPLDDLAVGLEWKPGYTIIVPGEWDVVERPGAENGERSAGDPDE